VPCVAPERLLDSLQQFDLAVDGEHFLYKCSAKVQKPKWERAFVLRVERMGILLKELAEIRAQLDDVRGFTSTRSARFYEHSVGDLAGTTEALRVGKTVVATESPDGCALAFLKGQRWMLSYGIAQFAQFSIDTSLSKGRLEGRRIKENVDILGKPLNKTHPLTRLVRAKPYESRQPDSGFECYNNYNSYNQELRDKL
jgi:hypothetical protein